MKIKIIVGIAIFIFWSATTAIITAAILSRQCQTNQTASQIPNQNLTNVTLNNAEIAKHNSSSDCWSIINGKVYNLTSYLNAHPAGALVITPFCGRDGSIGYNTKNIGRRHSSNADALLTRFLLGSLNETIGSDIIQNIQNQPSIPFSGEDDD